ncbi:homoserine O-succinyltransferase [Enterococcus sp.]|uniref:homoserine O-succinyltransferase n=1 Tax=Enterococcus sp. TaxID=35783 RepID=UPI000EB96D14|nr:homoserine O-succinyltransferase [Enterococcus sp.]HCE11351.1 homoserine O-succinyltransferase [Enterococcus sp.]
MPIIIPKELPAATVLQKENVFALLQHKAAQQEIRPLKIAIVNLMPQKIATENQLLRLLSQSPLQIEVTLLKMADHESKNTSLNHMEKFYEAFSVIQQQRFDGLIITGAPVEKMPFEAIDYWQELQEIMAWSQTNCTSVLHICWGAQAGLYYHYGIDKVRYPQKLFGVFEQEVTHFHPLVRGFDDVFYTPHSRYTGIDETKLPQLPLEVLAAGRETGPTMFVSENHKNVFLLGHFEYHTTTLNEEYLRDMERGLDTALPSHYFANDHLGGKITNRWRGHASLFFSNWINETYQRTPYDLTIKPTKEGYRIGSELEGRAHINDD